MQGLFNMAQNLEPSFVFRMIDLLIISFFLFIQDFIGTYIHHWKSK